MPAQILTQVDPQQFFRLPSTNATAGQRLDTKVSGVTVSNFSDRLSVTTAEGGTITLSADLESDFRAVNYTTEDDGQAVDIRKAANIFKQYVSGEDEEALAKAAKLAERFGHLSSLSDVDLSVDVERSNLPTQAAGQQQPTTGTTSGTATPGGAPSTVAAIPQSSTGTSAPTQPSTDATVPRSDVATRPLCRCRMRRTQPPATGPSEFPATMVSSALFFYQSIL
jgi:hypothetical protein